MNPQYWEDVQIGIKRELGQYTFTEEEIIRFGRKYDPQPFHVDPEAAKSSIFGGLIASGWHLTALAMRLSVEARSFGGTPIIGAGVDELRWLQPVRPGDALTLERVFEQIEAPVRPGGRGTVRSRMTVRNQRGEEVMTMLAIGKIPVRPT